VAETRVSMTDLRQNLGTLVNRAAYGSERIVLVSHGEPKAVIIGLEDLRQLERIDAGLTAQHDRFAEALAAADLLRERIARWQEAHGIALKDSVEDLRQLREERDREFAGLR
jgi:prevent-host-death family protein